MPTQTLDPSWTPKSCPASTDLWEIYLTTSAVFFNLGALTATSECAPTSYTPTVPYYAEACPTGFTSACAHGLDDSTTVCCPTARSMSCASTAKIFSSLTLSCEERFTNSYSALLKTTSVYGNSHQTGSALVTFTPDFDAVNGFGIEYVKMTSTPTATATTSDNTSTTTDAADASSSGSSSGSSSSGSSSSNSNKLSGGAIAGIVIAVLAFIIIIGLVWNRNKITAWIHRKTAPRETELGKMGPGSNSNSNANLKGNAQGYGQDGSSSSGSRGIVRGGVHELEPGWKPVELGTSQEIAEKDSGV